MSSTTYLEWLDWNPCILRSIHNLGKQKAMPIDKLNALNRSTKEKIGDYLVSIGIAELGQNSVVKLTPFGSKLYSKVLELEDVFVQGIEDVA